MKDLSLAIHRQYALQVGVPELKGAGLIDLHHHQFGAQWFQRHNATTRPVDQGIPVAPQRHRRNKALPEVSRRHVRVRLIMQHCVQRMIRCQRPLPFRVSVIQEHRQRAQHLRQQAHASPHGRQLQRSLRRDGFA
ncbi:hypothetical protein G6F68_014283 [Rhizopus microsporus]|nr:hypothetical protein G6F31_020358 [Rhizopus arrhizus]KAG1247243.1 hypothetical protein G6F68_014283 [Rhizopus microsporus]